VKEKIKLHSFIHQQNPWVQNGNSIWLASAVILLRNLEKSKFAAKLPADRRKQIISLVDKELQEATFVKNPKLYRAEDLIPLEKEYLFEHFLFPQSFQQAHAGEAFIVDDTGEFLAVLNIREHIQLMILDCHEDIENTWNRLVKIETALGKNINFSFSQKFGFLTADASQCGTGLQVYSFLHLPALIHTKKLEEAINVIHDGSVSITGLQGDPNEFIGDLVFVHNNYTLGLTEENIISTLRTFTTKLVLSEKSARSQMRNANNPEVKDKVSRAFGILIHSYQLEAIEALNALSLLKLGLDLGWVSGVTIQTLNNLLFKCRRAHLLCENEEQVLKEEIPHVRAAFIHKALQNIILSV